MPMFLFLLAAAAGVMIPLQAVVNARLGRAIGGPLWAAALVSSSSDGACLPRIGLTQAPILVTRSRRGRF